MSLSFAGLLPEIAHVFGLEHVLMQSWAVLPFDSLAHNSAFLHISLAVGNPFEKKIHRGLQRGRLLSEAHKLSLSQGQPAPARVSLQPRPMLLLGPPGVGSYPTVGAPEIPVSWGVGEVGLGTQMHKTVVLLSGFNIFFSLSPFFDSCISFLRML